MNAFQFNEIKQMKSAGYCEHCKEKVYEGDDGAEYDSMVFCGATCLGSYLMKNGLVESI